MGGLTGLATNIGAAHVVVSDALGLCTDAYTTGCWEKLSQTEQKRFVDAVADGVALGDARGANPTLTMSHLPLHRSSLASGKKREEWRSKWGFFHGPMCATGA